MMLLRQHDWTDILFDSVTGRALSWLVRMAAAWQQTAAGVRPHAGAPDGQYGSGTSARARGDSRRRHRRSDGHLVFDALASAAPIAVSRSGRAVGATRVR